MNKALALKEWVDENTTEKHLSGEHNQKRHGWRFSGLGAARRAMRSGVSEDVQGKVTPESERDAYRKRVGMTKIDRKLGDITRMTASEYHDKLRKETLSDTPGLTRQEYDDNIPKGFHDQEFLQLVRQSASEGKTISARTLDDIATNMGERVALAINHDWPNASFPKGYLTPDARRRQSESSQGLTDARKLGKVEAQKPVARPKNKVESGQGWIKKRFGKDVREVQTIISRDDLAKMKPDKIESIMINGQRFLVRRDDIGFDKNGRAMYELSVRVSPDYNKAAGFSIKAPTVSKLLQELENLDYQIVPVFVGFL